MTDSSKAKTAAPGDSLPDILIAADKALQEGKWEDARSHYQRALDLAPDNAQARLGLAAVGQCEQVDRLIQDLIRQGDEHFQGRRYEEALTAYSSALNEGGQHNIRRYHSVLEPKQDEARELRAWQRRIHDRLQEVQQHKNKGNLDAALHSCRTLLQELPAGERYDELAAPLRTAQHEVEGLMDDAKLFNKAVEARNKDKDYEECVRLAALVSPDSPDYNKAQMLHAQTEEFLNKYIRPGMKRAKEAFERKDWANAFAELDHLREKYPDSPVWQQLWLRVGMAHGQQELDYGRKANFDAQFKTAQSHFEAARGAFEKILRDYPSHMTAPALRDEAAELAQIAASEVQAQARWQSGQREEAQVALDGALKRIQQARSKGREYVTVSAVVETMHGVIGGELERIKQDGIRLQDGERLLTKEQRLDDAADCFRQTLTALLSEHQRQAADGLSRADATRRAFETKMKEGREATNPDEAVAALREAHNLWPSGPGVLQALQEALVRAGRAAHEAGRDKDAVVYFREALTLGPDKAARQGLERIEKGPAIEATLDEIHAAVDKIGRSGEGGAADLQVLEDKLEALNGEARPHPDLKERVETLLASTSQLRKKWQAFDKGRDQAEKAQQAGRWADGVKLLAQALTHLGDAAPPVLTQQLGAWQRVVDAAKTAEDVAGEALSQAQAGYEQSPRTGSFEELLQVLGEADEAFHRLDGEVMSSPGPLPPPVSTLRRQVDDLRRRVQIAGEAYNTRAATDGLLMVQKALQTWPGDATLQALEKALTERARDEVDRLVRQANELLKQGDLTGAEDMLRQAYQLRPEDPDIAVQYTALQQRRRLDERLRKVENDADDKLQGHGSITEARNVLQKGLEVFLEPEVDLPAEARELVEELLRLASREGGLALGLPEHWPRAQDIGVQLGKLGAAGWMARRASQMADRFAQVTRDHSLLGVVESRTSLKNYMAAHRAAREYLEIHPAAEDAITKLAATQENLVNQISESAGKRMVRARNARGRGDFDVALQDLAAVAEFYEPVDKEFPNLLAGYDELENYRHEAEDLKREIETLQVGQEEVLPALEAAEEAYRRSELAGVEKSLAGLGSLERLPALKARADELRTKLGTARQEDLKKRLRTGVHLAQTDLHRATTIAEVEQIEKDLEALRREIDIPSLPLEERDLYSKIHDDVRDQRESMKGGTTWEKMADDHLAQGKYQDAATALQEVIRVTRDGEKKAKLQARLNDIASRAAKQRECEDALTIGRQFFHNEQYREALQQLKKAKDLGADTDPVDRLVLACRAGILWDTARQCNKQAEAESDPDRKTELLEDALLELDEAPDLPIDDEDAQPIAQHIRSLRSLLNNRLGRIDTRRQKAAEAADKIRTAISEAQVALLAGELDTARLNVKEALGLAPDHQKALALEQEILQTTQVQRMLDGARASMAQGDYDGAIAQVNSILIKVQPDNPAAAALKEQIEIGRQANEALIRAEAMAHDAEFQQARQALQEAIGLGAAREQVRQVQDKVGELEQKWESETIEPIRKRMLDGEFENAHSLCKQALGRVASPDFRSRLETLKSDVVTRWVQRAMDGLRREVTPTADEATLEEVAVKLERLTSLDPPAYLAQEIATLSDTVNGERLKHMLITVQRLADQSAWEEAFERLKVIKSEADRLTLGPVAEQAMNLEWELNNRRINQERSAYQAERDRLMAEAQQVWQSPARRIDLERVGDLAQRALQVQGFEHDREAVALHKQAGEAIASFDSTEAAIRASRDRVRQRKFGEAEGVLNLSLVSPLLKTDYDRQHSLARILHQADEDQDRSAWETAFNGFGRAIEMDGSLEPLLQEDLARCRKWLMEQVLLRAQNALQAVPPDPEEARATIEQAKAEGWITPVFQADVDRLLGWSNSLVYVAQAADMLKQDTGDPKEALAALRNARHHLPGGQDEAVIRHWELLAEALLAWPDDLDQVTNCLNVLTATPLNDLSRVRRLRRDLTQKQEAQQASREEEQRRNKLVEQVRMQVEAALATTPPRCEDALAAVQQAGRQLGDDPRLVSLNQVMERRLYDLYKEAHAQGRFPEAIRLARLLAAQNPENETYRTLPEELITGRSRRLAQALDQAQVHIRAYRPDAAEQALAEATNVAEPEDEPAINAARRELQARRGLIADTAKHLDQATQAATSGQWEEALAQMQTARQKAPDYPPVKDTAAQIQEQMRAAAAAALAVEQLLPALSLCSQGLRLGRHEPLEALQQTVAAQRDARLAELRQQGQAALARWDLEAVDSILAQSTGVADADSSLQYLRDQARQMRLRADDVKQHMQAGWAALRSREYASADRAFEETLKAALAFREAQAWRDYTASLEQAVRLVRDDRWDAFHDVARLLREADARLCLRPDVQLPVLLPSLVDERKQALWNVRQLLPVADQIAALHEHYEAHYARNEVDQAYELMPQIEQQCEAFLRRHNSPSAPPPDFSGGELAPPITRPAAAAQPRREPEPAPRTEQPTLRTEEPAAGAAADEEAEASPSPAKTPKPSPETAADEEAETSPLPVKALKPRARAEEPAPRAAESVVEVAADEEIEASLPPAETLEHEPQAEQPVDELPPVQPPAVEPTDEEEMIVPPAWDFGGKLPVYDD